MRRKPAVGLSLPELPDVIDRQTLVPILHEAGEVLEREGRRALSGCVFGAGGAMRESAAALRLCVVTFQTYHAPVREIAWFTARELERVGGFLHWKRPLLKQYAAALRLVARTRAC